MSKMSRKRKVVDKTKMVEKMSTYMMLMGFNSDYHLTVAKELSRCVWMRKGRLSRKSCRRLQYLLCASDSATLLSFTVSLGKLIWSENLRLKRMKLEKILSEKIKKWSSKKSKRRGKPGRVRAKRGKKQKVRKGKGNAGVSKVVTGFHIRPVWGSKLRMVVRRKVARKHVKPDFGSPMHRLALAMSALAYRNVYVTSEWEFWAVCFVQKFCGFWRSIAFADGLSDSLISVAKEFGLCVVSSDHLERMESCFGCSSSARYQGSRLAK